METNPIISHGFAVLKTRLPKDDFNIHGLEQKYSLAFPPRYRLFISLFDLEGMESQLEYEDGEGNPDYFGGLTYLDSSFGPDQDIVMFDEFLPPEVSLSNWDADDDWAEAKFLPIATCGHGGNVLLGYSPQNGDQVFLQDQFGQVFLLNNDIFDFVKHLAFEAVPEEELDEGVTYDQLYRNLGEDIFRIHNQQTLQTQA
jgi:hypothetical protein